MINKRLMGWLAVTFTLISLVGGALLPIEDWYRNRYTWAQLQKAYGAIGDQLSAQGLGPEMRPFLERLPKLRNTVAIYVSRPLQDDAPQPSVSAGSPVDLFDHHIVHWQSPDQQPGRFTHQFGWTIQASDGSDYMVTIVGQFNLWLRTVAGFSMIGGGALAWLAMALWIFLDAHERSGQAAAGWLLLGLVTGPAAVAAWVIVRPPAEPNRLAGSCPGCGEPTVKGAAFCVKCGHKLHPTCPDCHGLVQTDWSHCAACGCHLVE